MEMSIKNKDGSLFKLQKVNPLMKNQDHWKDEWKVHYVETDPISVQDPKRIISDQISQDTPVPAIIGVGIVSQTEILYCLPLVIKIVEDELYNQKKKYTSWGDQFSFEAIKVDYTGITAVFFAKIPNKLERGSIIYVYKERQWWKINGIESVEDGINIYCIPSDQKPSFIV